MSIKRLEPTIIEPTTISRANFDADFKFGYAALEFIPEQVVVHTDSRSGREIRRTQLAEILYRCVRCQFDTLDKQLIDKHLVMGEHPWAYPLFESPYGHIADYCIEGIDDYTAFLAQKEK